MTATEHRDPSAGGVRVVGTTLGARRDRAPRLLAAELGIAPSELVLTRDSCGRPSTRASETAGLAFSVSHAPRLTLVATSLGREVGVDVEPGDRRVTGLSLWRHVLSDREQRRLPADLARRNRALLTAWVAKEAVAKAAGLGLAADLRGIELDRDAAIEALPAPFGDPDDWSLTFLDVPGHVAAVACRPAACDARLEWEPRGRPEPALAIAG